MLRIEVMVHNAAEAPFRRWLVDLPKTVAWMRRVVEHFLNTLRCVEACFIADETLEQLPDPSMVGQTRVGGVDFNRPRMRLAIQAMVALSTSPKGFTAGEVAGQVRTLGGLPEGAYGTRQAAYDIKKLRGNGTKSSSPSWPRNVICGAGGNPATLRASTRVTTRCSAERRNLSPAWRLLRCESPTHRRA